jgi:hypothetical protein
MEPEQKKGCGCNGDSKSPNDIVFKQRSLSNSQMELAELIKSVHKRKSKISKTRFQHPL